MDELTIWIGRRTTLNHFSIITDPFIYLGFIALHGISGQGLTGYLYWRRFKKNPVIYYKNKDKNNHSTISSWLSIPVGTWFISLCLYAFSGAFRHSILGWNWFHIAPIFGWLIGSIGLIGMLICQYQMGEAFRVGQEDNDQQSQNIMYHDRCFKYTRNPIYFFSILYLFGVSLWAMILPVWLSLVAIIMLIHHLVLTEEQFLTQRFGERYIHYKNEVPRYWPLRIFY